MPTILEEAEDNMEEAISKGGKNSCDPNQVGNYGSRKKNQELLPTNSNPKIYHGQGMKGFLCAGP